MDYYQFNVKALEHNNHKRICERLEENYRQVIDVGFGDTQEKLNEII